MTYDENSNPMNSQQEEAWLDDLKASLDEEPDDSRKPALDDVCGDSPKPASDFPNPFQTEMSDLFREFGADEPEKPGPAAHAVKASPVRQEKLRTQQQAQSGDAPPHAVLILTILVLLEAAAIIAVAVSWLLWVK